MDSMENGTSAAVGSNQNTESGVDFGSGVQVKSVIDRNSVTLGFKSKNYKKIDGHSIPILDFDHDGVDSGDSIELLNRRGQNILRIAAINGKANMVSHMLKVPELKNLINGRDKKGNTPLHLATAK
ncbi:hypothetical protein F0562_010868 [Nyssa sinensis]|uniref:Uncharacterized protein n=1 Tax=Nyssa sinensis TaxID=561372 RepID=A0A5J5A327_9ASTE|nr:hypothetical protein F0562_010868 [Nyssa sinensis]